MKQEDAIKIIIREAKKNKNILALGIGGSFARKENDTMSDIDIYIILSEDCLSGYSDIVNKISFFLPPILNYNEVGIHQGFGYLYQVVFDSCLIIDFNFNAIDSLQSHPTWRNRIVIYDRSGKFEYFINNENNKWTIGELYKYHYDLLPNLSNIFWRESYLKAYKSILRSNLLSAIRFQQRMKEILFFSIRLHFRLFSIVPDNPFKNIESDFKEYPEILEILINTQPRYSFESVIDSIKNTVLYFEKYNQFHSKSKEIKKILQKFPINNLM